MRHLQGERAPTHRCKREFRRRHQKPTADIGEVTRSDELPQARVGSGRRGYQTLHRLRVAVLGRREEGANHRHGLQVGQVRVRICTPHRGGKPPGFSGTFFDHR